MKKGIALLLVFSFLIVNVFSEIIVTTEELETESIPEWATKLRRSEVITFGSLPFVTLNVSTIYSVYRYVKNDFSSDFFPNPLAKSSDASNFTTDEQTGILITSLCISLAIGITDFIIDTIKERKEEEELLRNAIPREVTITTEIAPVEE